VIVVEKWGYESEMKRIEKEDSGLFPLKLHFVLQPTLTVHEPIPTDRDK
jgi:hypothetical protein